MISWLSGIVIDSRQNFIVLNVNGVGYKVFVPSNILSKYQKQDKLDINIYTQVREDTLDLYGFIETNDLRLFEMIIGVSGIGCKTAIGIFDKGDGSQIIDAILKSNTGFFTGVPRLGKKNAQKLIIELKGKLGDSQGDLNSVMDEEGLEIEAALRSIGYSQKEASQAAGYANNKGKDTQERLKIALKYLGK